MNTIVDTFFEELDQKLWKVHNAGKKPSSSSIGQYHIESDGEFVTKSEWDKIKLMVAEHNLICLPGSGVFGLSGYSLSFWCQPDDPGNPTYPGTEEAFKPGKATCLGSITHVHMQKVLRKSRGDRELLDSWWAEIEKLCFTDKNKALVAKYKLGKMHERSYYDY